MKKRKLSGLLAFSTLLAQLTPGFGVSTASADVEVKPRPPVTSPSLPRPDLSGLTLDASGKEAMRSRSTGEGTPSVHAIAGALRTSESKAAAEPKNYVPASTSHESITVIVELQSDPVAVYEANAKQGLAIAGGNQRSRIAAEQAAFSSAVMKTFGVRLNRTYDTVFNGGALTIPANQVGRLLQLPGVKAVYPSRTYTVDPIKEGDSMTNYSAPFIGAQSYWDSGIDGSGIKVGVIDSGIDYNHPSLKDAYKGGYDFVDQDADPMETPPDPANPNAATQHGTHVSGILAGRGEPDIPNSSTGAVRGVAPGADLYVYRVLGPGGDGTFEDEIAGIERAVEDGMDIINLSMGSPFNNQYEPDAIAVNNAVRAGVVVVASNGNEGLVGGTLSSPGVAEMAITVNASTAPAELQTLSGISSVTGASSFTLHQLFQYANGDYSSQLNKELQLEYVGLGAPSDFEGKDLTGRIALIKRGEIKFVNKVENARQAGAAAAIVFNSDDEDDYIDANLDHIPAAIPTFEMRGADGRALMAALMSAGSGSFTLTGVDVQEIPGDELYAANSRGPSLPGFEIKPDITAPGVSIFSSVPGDNGQYNTAYDKFSGTSMAAPHIAGAAALVLDQQPELQPDEVKSLLMNTTYKLEKSDHTRYSVMEQGAGRVDLTSAFGAKAVAMVRDVTDATEGGAETEYHTGSLSFGRVGAGETFSRTVDVKDIAGQASSYNVSAIWYGAGAGSLTVSTEEVQVAPDGTASFDVVLSVGPDTPASQYEGEIVLTSDDDTLRIPVVVYVANVVSDIHFYPEIFSPNQDSKTDVSSIGYKVNKDNQYISLDVFNEKTGRWVGMIMEEENGQPPGNYGISEWNGVVFNFDEEFMLPDGSYLLIPYYGDEEDDYKIEEEAVPFVIDTDAPESALTGPMLVEGDRGIIRGQIGDDLLIDHFGDYGAIFTDAWYKVGDQWESVIGTIEDDGSFELQVPIHTGFNEIEVFVYDSVGNGEITPAYYLTYTKPESGPAVSVSPSKPEVKPGDSFTIDVRFSDVQDLYSAQFSLTSDSQLTRGETVPSVTLNAYQQEQIPDGSLIVNESTTALENGLIRTDYVLTMTGEINGYSGDGTLATFQFQAGETGEYPFELSNVRFLNSMGEEMAPGEWSGATVKVTQGGGGPIEYHVTGTIHAQGLAEGTDYSTVWYEGEDGTLRVTVEALDSQGTVVKAGTVQADGTYTLSVPAGSYTIRVRVPGHSSAAQSVEVTGDTTVSFELGRIAAGDVSGDSSIDLLDLNRAARAFGKSAPWSSKAVGEADINRDGVINMLDISFILENYSTGE